MKRIYITLLSSCMLLWITACNDSAGTVTYSEDVTQPAAETTNATITDIIVDEDHVAHAQEPEIPLLPGAKTYHQETTGNSAAANSLRQDVVAYAATLEGIPYKVMGKDEKGFDCSGFVSYVFKEFDVDIPSSSRHMMEYGEEVKLEEAMPGDIVFFTGTNPDIRQPGHVGIVVSQPGEPLTFIHSSSSRKDPCVKYSEMSEAYQTRYLATKRILEN